MGCVTVVGAGLRRQEQRERDGTGEAVFESVRKALENQGGFPFGQNKKAPKPLRFQDFFVITQHYRFFEICLKKRRMTARKT